MVYAIIITSVSLLLSLVVTKKMFAPTNLVAALWLFCILAYNLYPHQLFPLNNQFYTAISIWVGAFTFSSLFVQGIYQKPNNTHEPNLSLRNLYFFLSVVSFVYMLWYIVSLLGELGLSTNLFLNLRNAALGKFKGMDEGTSNNYFAPLWLVSYVIEILHYKRKRTWILIILLFINLGWAVLIMSKLTFLYVFISTFVILLYKNKIKTRTILISLATIFVFFSYFQVLRSTKAELDGNKLNYDFFSLYVLTGIPAFETIQPNSSDYYGQNSFRFFYAISYKTGFGKKEPVNPILEFIHPSKDKTINTNVYTAMYPYFKDFGYLGVFIFALLIGMFYGYIFKKATKKDNPMIVAYSIFATGLILQFMNEMTFTTLSFLLQILIISHLPYWINKKTVKTELKMID